MTYKGTWCWLVGVDIAIFAIVYEIENWAPVKLEIDLTYIHVLTNDTSLN